MGYANKRTLSTVPVSGARSMWPERSSYLFTSPAVFIVAIEGSRYTKSRSESRTDSTDLEESHAWRHYDKRSTIMVLKYAASLKFVHYIVSTFVF